MFWNGKFKQIQILEQKQINNTLFWKIIEIDKKKERWVIPKKIQNILPCLIDELKPLFGLYKIGTCWCFHESKKYLLMKAKVRKGILKEDKLFLEGKKFKEKQLYEVRKIILFRYIFSLPFPRKQNLILRRRKVISCLELGFSRCENFFNQNIYSKWFENIEPSEVLRNLLEIKEERDTVEKIYMQKIQIRTITSTLDPKELNHIDKIFYKRATERCSK